MGRRVSRQRIAPLLRQLRAVQFALARWRAEVAFGERSVVLRQIQANRALAFQTFEADTERLVSDILSQSWFSHRANKRLLNETEGLPLSAGLAHEIYKNEGRGPDMQSRIAAFTSRTKP